MNQEFLIMTGLMISVSLVVFVLIMASEIGFLKARVKNLEDDRARRELEKPR